MKLPFNESCRRGAALKPLAIAVALALPSASAWAASMKDVVATRADRNIDQHYGRDSVYAIAGDKRLKPGHSVADMGRLSKAKLYRAAALGNKASLVTPQSVKSGEVLMPSGPQTYGRAGGYVGWERIAVMRRPPTTLITSTFPDRHAVNLAARPEDDGAAVRQGVRPYRRESAAGYDEEVNRGIPATNEGERRSAGGTNPITRVIEQPNSAVTALLEPTSLSLYDQVAAPLLPSGDMRAMEYPSGGQKYPSTEATREPQPFTNEDDNSSTIRGESAATSVMDDVSGVQIVRT
jgi:hypothetical protein